MDYHSINEKNYNEYKEKVTHGTPLLPFAQYHTKVSEQLPFQPIHWHEEMEIIKVQSGIGEVSVDGVKYTAEAGDIIILRPFVMHAINRLGNNEMIADVIVFNLRLLETGGADVCTLKYFAPLLNEKHSVPCIVRPTDSWYHPFDQSMTSILMSDSTKEGAELDIKANLYWMFYHIYNNRLMNVKQNLAEDRRLYTVRKALEYIRAEYMNEITIEKLSKHCGYSEFYTMKLFKQLTGVSVVDYVNNYRLTVAGRQLRDTQDDVATIAYQVGYNNVSYFNRQFKKQYGMTPRQFRFSLGK
ncbi:MAG: helix-turn-helix domain-containing protein [Clostridiales bacterium]|nr:helix-turn-helix domain-containing protein [Clostridiales bacterium]